VEGVYGARHRGELPGRLLRILAFVAPALVVVLWQNPVWASDGQGQRNSSPTAAATVNGGTITVQAGDESWSPPAGSRWAQAAQSDPPRGKPNPNQPYGCTYAVPTAQYQQLMGTGGPTPGKWVIPTCSGPGPVDPMPPFWVVNAKTQTPPANPVVLVQQALSKLPLPTPTIEMAPPADQDQLVNVSTWLWIDPGSWRGLSASATAGPVTTTATASPAEVVWQMGDGQSVTCLGPGTPYEPSQPNATTNCSYAWTESSAGQPGGVYQVTATVYYRAAWTAAGAPGGGSLGLVAGPSAHVAVRVAESEAINNPPGSS
jgi:hypothetical protein